MPDRSSSCGVWYAPAESTTMPALTMRVPPVTAREEDAGRLFAIEHDALDGRAPQHRQAGEPACRFEHVTRRGSSSTVDCRLGIRADPGDPTMTVVVILEAETVTR